MTNPTALRAVAGVALLAAAASGLSSCTAVRVGPGRAPDNFDYVGLGNAYASVNDLREYDGDILQMDILDGYAQQGEILNLDLWPIAGIGIGLFGVRAHIVSLGAGVGTLFYKPYSQANLLERFGDGEKAVEIK